MSTALDAAEAGQATHKGLEAAGFGEDQKCQDLHELQNAPIDEDLYGFATVALLRDSHFLAEPNLTLKQRSVRYVRMTISLLMIVMNTALQVYLIYNVKKFITAATVLNIRGVYDFFETDMYDKTAQTVNRNQRGLPGHFHADHFATLSESHKEEACQIPLSQPHFLLVFIFLWSLTCLSDVKVCLKFAEKVFCIIPTVSTMQASMQKAKKKSSEDPDPDPAIREVVGITWPLRFALLFLVILPRLLVGLALLWLGCRWLIATNSFADLFLNAVALGFIFDLKESFYNQLLPDRNKRDVQNTVFPPTTRNEAATVGAYVKGLVIVPVTLAWALFYMYQMQAVLPEYNWDVHEVCKEWLAEHYAL